MFNPTAAINFELSHASKVSIKVFGVRGNLVRVLLHGTNPAGPGSVNWDGRDDAGSPVASGAYFVEMQAGSYRATQRTLLLK